MRSISLCIATSFLLLLAGCAAKSSTNSLTPLTVSMGKNCTVNVFADDVLKYEFTASGTQFVQQGVYAIHFVCPTWKQSFLSLKIGADPVELAAGPGADVNALGTVLTHSSPQ